MARFRALGHRNRKSLYRVGSGLHLALLSMGAPPSPLSSRPERIRISYFALLATTTGAALRKESRMQTLKATGLHRKSGGAQWRDLRFSGPFLEMFFEVWRRRLLST
jgi:hypothetical protein